MDLPSKHSKMIQIPNVQSMEESGGMRWSTRVKEVAETFGKQVREFNVERMTTSSSGPNHLERLPDELIARIINFVGMASSSAAITSDPYEMGWKDEEEVVRSATSFAHSVAVLRLVCWRFFHLATPSFFKRLVICDSQWKCTRQPTQFILKLGHLLSTPGPTIDSHQQIPINSLPHSLRNRGCYHANRPPYGHHVRQLIIFNRAIPPLFISRLIDMIHSLIPYVTALSGLNLSYMPFFLSPVIHFPRLVSITGIEIAPYSDAWTGGYLVTRDSFNHARTFEGRGNLVSQEIFLGILNKHPQISHLACRGLHIDESGSQRILALLRTNQLSVALLPPYRRSEDFVGLKILHIGDNSVIDLHMIRLLPGVAPHLQQLHIDAGCQLEDKASNSLQTWSLSHLLEELPQLTHFTFIAQQSLPSRQGSTKWASSNKIISISPFIQSLNLRMDSFTSASFFDGLDGATSLRKLNVWHRPPLSMAPESWSIISFGSVQEVIKLGGIMRAMNKLGLEWPQVEDQQRDLWLKLKALTQMEMSDI